jgi:hypothetical protein
MKKLPAGHRLKLIRLQRRRERKRVRRRAQLRSRRAGLRAVELYFGSGQRGRTLAAEGRRMPRSFSLSTNFVEVAQFLDSLRTHVEQGIQRSFRNPKTRRKHLEKWYDLATIEHITPASALVLASEFDRGRLLTGRALYAVDLHKWRPEVAEVLKQVGFLPILGIEGSSARPDGANIVVVPARSSDQVVGEEVSKLTDELAEFVITATAPASSRDKAQDDWLYKASQIYIVLLEAMNNVVEHAYPTNVTYQHRPMRRWWMTGSLDRNLKRLSVVIYDQGVSIPYSLPNSAEYTKMAKIYHRLTGTMYDRENAKQDGAAIAAAMQVAKSRTGQPHRGRGLALMREFLNTCKDGSLRIVSRNGECTYSKATRGPVTKTYPIGLRGTLIEWEMVL